MICRIIINGILAVIAERDYIMRVVLQKEIERKIVFVRLTGFVTLQNISKVLA